MDTRETRAGIVGFLLIVWIVLLANLAGLAIDIYRAGWFSRSEASDVVLLAFLMMLAWRESRRVWGER